MFQGTVQFLASEHSVEKQMFLGMRLGSKSLGFVLLWIAIARQNYRLLEIITLVLNNHCPDQQKS